MGLWSCFKTLAKAVPLVLALAPHIIAQSVQTISFANMASTVFSDYNVAKLIPRDLRPAATQTINYQTPGVWTYPGTQTRIFGPEAARAAEAAWEQEMGIVAPQPGSLPDPDLESEENAGNVQFDLDAYMQGLIANNGTLPDMVYTAIPIFKGVESTVCR